MPFLRRIRKRLSDDPRLAKMLHGGASGLLGRGVSLLASAITLPLTVRYLGKLEYGIWITISTSVAMFSVMDLGMANTLTNFISEAYAEGDKVKAQRYYATAFWVTMLLATLMAAAGFLAWRSIDWGSLLHLSDPTLIAHARVCVAISVVFFLFSLPLSLTHRVLGGYQEVHLANYFSMVNSLLGLISIVGTILFHGGLVALMLAYCSAMLLGGVGLNLWISIWNKPWMRPSPGHVQLSAVRALFGQGILFFVLQLTTLVVFNSDNLVITHFLGASEVTPYSISWRLVGYATMFQSLLVPSFWPAFTEAYKNREMGWMNKTYNSMVRQTMLLVSAIACCMGLVGREVIRIWAGEAAVPNHMLLWTMVAWAVMSTFTTNQALLLTATGRLRLEATVAVIAAVLNLGLSVILVQRIGAEGVVLATVVSFAVCMVIPQQREVRRVLAGVFLPAREPAEAGLVQPVGTTP